MSAKGEYEVLLKSGDLLTMYPGFSGEWEEDERIFTRLWEQNQELFKELNIEADEIN
jgi:hypothetical protein